MLDDKPLLVPCQQGLATHGRSRHRREGVATHGPSRHRRDPVHAVPVGPEGQEVTTLCRLQARRLAGVFDPAAQDACKRCVAKALGRAR